MFVRLVRFRLNKDGRPKAASMAGDLIPAIKQQPGCLSAAFFGDRDDGDSGICVFWDTQEHANAAAAVISGRLEGHLSGNIVAPPERRLFPVIAS